MHRIARLIADQCRQGRVLLGLAGAALAAALLVSAPQALAESGEVAVPRTYITAPPAPRNQPGATFEEQRAAVQAKSDGCYSCHVRTDEPSMHASPAVQLGCVDCHGGDATVRGNPALGYAHADNMAALSSAHVLPKYPRSWNWPSSANPQRSYALLNREAPEFIRFVNPADYRIARESCGACHLEIIENAERSIMATGAMLWGGASYNNGIVPFKNYLLGESFTREGDPACIVSPSSILPRDQWARACTDVTMTADAILTPEEQARGALARLYPLPSWTVVPPGDVFRVFERGGRTINPVFPEIGLPNPLGQIQRLEEPGRPDIRQSNRGPGTGLRVAIPVLNIHKTRLNDPLMWHMGTNDQPGDYRQSGCSGCHVVYANDREPRHSSVYAPFGRDGQTQTLDPTINQLMHRPGGAHGEGPGGAHGEGPGGAHGDDAHGSGHAAAPRHPAPPSATRLAALAPSAEESGHGSLRPAGAPDRRESGHPIRHAFTRAIPTAQCMNCHMHQPNIFLNSYLGYTMWDYESDAPAMWPGPENTAPRPEGMSDADYQRLYRQQRYPTMSEVRETNNRNPEAAAVRGLWSDVEFLRDVYSLNGQLRDTQFADYHGHGWNFRAILKRDREGNLLDADGNMASYGTDTGNIVAQDDPERWRRQGEGEFVPIGTNPGKTVHMMDIHAEKGLQCADCHFAQDSHGNGFIYGEVANAIEIGCKDCHGTADAYPTLLTSGPAAPPSGTNLAILRNPDGKRRFEWLERDGRRVLVQRAIADPSLEWEVSLVRDTVTRGSASFNPRAARAKLMGHADADGNLPWGEGVAAEDRAHGDDSMACFTCHLSWTTSCGGCHLPIEANWETSEHHFEGNSSRNFATYNPQVARDEMFQLGRHQTTRSNIIAPVRSTSALILSSTNINRERIYVQQPPISAIGFSSQAFAPHFPHTVRTQETKTCSDCHISADDDNNAILSQLLLLGTNFVNFVGLNNWAGLEGGFQATRVTEWDEPQTVIGSYLHRYAWPDYYRLHVERNGRELVNWVRGSAIQGDLSAEARPPEEFANVVQGTRGAVRCLQMRGEYMFVAEGDGGFAVYDIAQIANKGYSERIVSAPFSPLGHNARVRSRNATCMALATNQPINPLRNTEVMRTINQEQPFHPIYHYAVITDAEEGLILVDVNTFADGELRNNNLRRALTWNPDGVLDGASHITLSGHFAYVTTTRGLVAIDLNDPLNPRVTATVPLTGAKASTQQFRYLWVSDAEGIKLFDMTDLATPVAVPSGDIALPSAQKMYIARTYLYIAAKDQGLVIVNVTRPTAPRELMRYTAAGTLTDAEDVIVATTNASLFAYVADGRNGVKVLQLTSPASQPNFYGFSPAPVPELIAFARTPTPALSMSKGLDRDRAVDETGGQMAVFGRLGSRPFTRAEMERLFRTRTNGLLYKVRDTVDMAMWRGRPGTAESR
jgi:hypothetical protein